MKKYLLLMAAAIVMLSGCKKDLGEVEGGPAPDNRTNAEKILGRWDVVLDKSYQSYTEPGYEQTDYCSDNANEITLTFSAEGMLTYHCSKGSGADEWLEDWSDPYQVVGDTLKWDVFDYHIEVLDQMRLVMEAERKETISRSNGSTYETREVRHYEMNRNCDPQ